MHPYETERLKTPVHLALTPADAVVEFVNHAVMRKSQHPERVANNPGNNNMTRRTNAISLCNRPETMPDMVMDAPIHDLNPAPPGCLRQVNDGLR